MPATYPLPSLAPTVSTTGITAPSYAEILASLQASFRIIYGSDSYIEPDSQDGQLLAIFARAIHDCNQATIAAYNSFSPATAQGEGLSSVVKINHIARSVPSNSQVNVTLVGQAGTVVVGGIVASANGDRWMLPPTVTIPFGGAVTVSATAEKPGAVVASIGAVNKIVTPTAGWQSVSNATAASPGEPVESDAALRVRQQTSTALRSLTVLDGMVGALQSLLGVTYAFAYENDTSTVDANGIPAHSIAVVVEGGLADEIADTIFKRKTPGCGTFGNTAVGVIDPLGVPRVINYFVPEVVLLQVTITLVPGMGYTATIGHQIKQAMADFVNSLPVGRDVEVTRLYLPALLGGTENSNTYELGAVQAGLVTGGLDSVPVVLAFNQKAGLQLSDITLTTT